MRRIYNKVCLFALMSAALCLSAAANPDWNPGGGFIVNGTKAKEKVRKTSSGLEVTQGGYYIGNHNWGGVVSKTKCKLDGFKMQIRFDRVPEMSPTDDAWISIGFNELPQMFQLRDIAGNRGYVCLIRLGRGRLVSYENLTRFNAVNTLNHSSLNLKSGDTLTVEVKKNGDAYEFYFNEMKVGYSFSDFGDIFPSGEAYVVVSASMKGSAGDAFTYTILNR